MSEFDITPTPEYLPDFRHIRVGLSMKNHVFFGLIASRPKVFGKLFKHEENIGFLGFTRDLFFLGTNPPIELISRGYYELMIRQCPREIIEEGLLRAPQNNLIDILFRLNRKSILHSGVYTIDTIEPAMVELLQTRAQ